MSQDDSECDHPNVALQPLRNDADQGGLDSEPHKDMVVDKEEHTYPTHSHLVKHVQQKLHVAVAIALLEALILIPLVIVGFSRHSSSSSDSMSIQGSQPPLILISFDGFRHDYAQRTDTPNIHRLLNRGLSAGIMRPIFPSTTFPNHYTLVTGLYAESHGIVSNSMWDPTDNTSFSLGNQAAVRNPKWWGGEPIWVTVRKSNKTAATMFWPGSEAPIKGMLPNYWLPFDDSVSPAARVQQVLSWLDLPKEAPRPDFLSVYFSDADHAGHSYGPDSPQVIEAIQRLDHTLGLLLDGLESRGLEESVNVILVADHGMAQMNQSQEIRLADYIDLNSVFLSHVSPIAEIWPKDGSDSTVDTVFSQLNNAHPHLRVWKKQDIPARFHFYNNPRIAPIVALADKGWTIMGTYFSHGAHG